MADPRETLKLALQHHQAGHYAEAERAYREVLAWMPGQADALHLLGVIANQTGDPAKAVKLIREALRARPEFADALSNLGIALKQLGRREEAIEVFEKAIELKPELAAAHQNLGNLFSDAGESEKAVAVYRRSLELMPGKVEVLVHLGNELRKMKRYDEALAILNNAHELAPKNPLVLVSLGNWHQSQWDLPTAEKFFREALRKAPDYSVAHNNLGRVQHDLGQFDEAVASFRTAIQLDSDFADAHFHLALVLLQMGAWEEGLGEYEWRLKRLPPYSVATNAPSWDGSDMSGKAILIRTEQGLGDTIQFARFAAAVKLRGASRVILEVQPSLASVLSNCEGVDQLIFRGEPLPPHDLVVSLLSLPGVLEVRPESIPPPNLNFESDTSAVEAWRERFGSSRGEIAAGIVWKGNPKQENDRNRSTTRDQFAPLEQVPGVRLVSLQFDAGEVDLPNLEQLTDRSDPRQACLDTALAIESVDVVISVCTSVAHLAASLGKPTWILLAANADWRWFRDEARSPWYPSVRLFRQRTLGDWSEVMVRVQAPLRQEFPSLV